jgi:hypothetical protein
VSGANDTADHCLVVALTPPINTDTPDSGGHYICEADISLRENINEKSIHSRGGRFLDFLDFQPVATGSRCKMLF